MAKTTKRVDPDTRDLDFTTAWLRLANQDPSKVYCYVYKGDALTGVPMYEARGWSIVLYDPNGGVKPEGVKSLKEGDPIEFGGCVLMECDREQVELVERAGRQWADRVENYIIDKRSQVRDMLRGIPGRYASVESDTTRLTPGL